MKSKNIESKTLNGFEIWVEGTFGATIVLEQRMEQGFGGKELSVLGELRKEKCFRGKGFGGEGEGEGNAKR